MRRDGSRTAPSPGRQPLAPTRRPQPHTAKAGRRWRPHCHPAPLHGTPSHTAPAARARAHPQHVVVAVDRHKAAVVDVARPEVGHVQVRDRDALLPVHEVVEDAGVGPGHRGVGGALRAARRGPVRGQELAQVPKLDAACEPKRRSSDAPQPPAGRGATHCKGRRDAGGWRRDAVGWQPSNGSGGPIPRQPCT